MTDTPIAVEVNCETGEVTERQLTAEEIAERELSVIQIAAEQAEHEAQQAAKDALKASAKAKLIAGQPLTAEEADTLVI
jgi:hypothetical protein